MKKAIAFDASETITKHPEVFREMAHDLSDAGWDVFILSPNEIGSIHRDLAQAGFDESKVIILNRGDKGAACEEHEIAVLLDDNQGYLHQCTKRVARLKVLGHKNPEECCD